MSPRNWSTTRIATRTCARWVVPVLRFANEDVIDNVEAVVARIEEAIKAIAESNREA